MNKHKLTISFSPSDPESLRAGIQALTDDINLAGDEHEWHQFRDYTYAGVDEQGSSLGKQKVCKAAFYDALAAHDELRSLLVAYIKKVAAYNFYGGCSFALQSAPEVQLIKDPVTALIAIGPEYIDLYCDAYATSDRGYGLSFDKPKELFARKYPDSEQLALLYAANISGRLLAMVGSNKPPKQPPASFIARFTSDDYKDYFVRLCAAEFIRNAFINKSHKYHLGLSALKLDRLLSDLEELAELFEFQPDQQLLLQLTGFSEADVVERLRNEVIGIMEGNRVPVHPVTYDFILPKWLAEKV